MAIANGINSGATITLGGNFATSGANPLTITTVGSTNVTSPTSGTLATTAGATIPTIAQGDLLYGSAANVLSALAKDTNATRYLSNTGTTNNPAWAQVSLTTGITGVLLSANGGTGVNNGSSTITLAGNLITIGAFSATFTMTSTTTVTFPTSGTLATTAGAAIPSLVQGDLLYASNTNVLSALNKNTTATRYLSNTGSNNNPAWAQVDLTNGVTGTLPIASGGTAATSFTAYMPITGGTTTTGALQSVSTTNALAGYNLTFVSTSALPTWQPTGSGQNHIMQLRLTSVSGSPVTFSATAVTTIYLTPFIGNSIALYNGSTWWDVINTAEISIAVPATTNTLYDVFCYNNSGAATLELLAWTNDLTRATALVTQDGVLVKTGATTRRWIGCMRTNAVSGQTEDTNQNRLVYNFYNQQPRSLNNNLSTNSWTWNGTYGSWRPAANDAANNQVNAISGAPAGYLGSSVNLTYNILTKSSSTNITIIIGISRDLVDPPSGFRSAGGSLTATAIPAAARWISTTEAPGYHTYTAYEYLNGASDTATFTRTLGIACGSLSGSIAG